MRLTYNGTIYRIGFEHGTEINDNIPGLPATEQDYTVATIRTGERPESGNDNILATGKVHRFHTDLNVKEKARKYALRTALRNMGSAATPEFRLAFWDNYHSRPGGINANKPQAASATTGG